MFIKIRKLAERGYTLAQLRKECGVSERKVKDILSTHGYESYSMLKQEIEDDWLDKNSWKLMSLIESGISCGEVQRKMGINYGEVIKILKHLDYKSYIEARDDLYYFRVGVKMKDDLVQNKKALMEKYGIYPPCVDRIARMHGEKNFIQFYEKYVE